MFVMLLVETGCRKSEILERTWDDLDLAAKTIKLATSKNGKPRVLHFSDSTAALIARVCPVRPAGSLIFPGRGGIAPQQLPDGLGAADEAGGSS